MRVAPAIVVLGIVTICSVAAADPAQTFEAAIKLEATQPAEAVTQLEMLAGEHPGDEVAPDALAEAATISEEKLFDPGRALTDWRAVIDRYPESRVAARARTRVAELGTLGPDAAQLGKLERLMAGTGDHPTREQRAAVESFLDDHPLPALRARTTYWLARAAEDASLDAETLHWYEETARIGGPWAARADRAAAALLKRKGRYAEAEAAYQKLSRYSDEVSRLAQNDGLLSVRRARRLRILEIGSWVFIVLFALTHAWIGRRHFLPVPVEVRFLVPVVTLFTVGAMAQHRIIAYAVLLIGGSGVLSGWLAAANRRALAASRGPLRIPLRMVLALVSAIAVLAVAYLAVRRWDLVEQVRETMMAGPDR